MRRYTSTTRVTKDGSFDFFDKSDDGELCRFEDVQALAKKIWPHFIRGFDHAKDCAPISSGLPCTCGADSLRDQLKSLIEAKP